MYIVALSSEAKKMVTDSNKDKKVIHSLDSLSYLKVDPLNFLNFRCQDYDNRIISVEQECILHGDGAKEA